MGFAKNILKRIKDAKGAMEAKDHKDHKDHKEELWEKAAREAREARKARKELDELDLKGSRNKRKGRDKRKEGDKRKERKAKKARKKNSERDRFRDEIDGKDREIMGAGEQGRKLKGYKRNKIYPLVNPSFSRDDGNEFKIHCADCRKRIFHYTNKTQVGGNRDKEYISSRSSHNN